VGMDKRGAAPAKRKGDRGSPDYFPTCPPIIICRGFPYDSFLRLHTVHLK
jgi:hypothetical protein